jgi:hypothetical protein
MFVLAIQASHTAPSRLIFAGFFHSRVVRNYGSFRFQPTHCKSAAGRLPFFTLRDPGLDGDVDGFFWGTLSRHGGYQIASYQSMSRSKSMSTSRSTSKSRKQDHWISRWKPAESMASSNPGLCRSVQ